jgi:hypothetical protein
VPASWATVLADTAIDPSATVTPEMMARLGVDPTVCARAALPFDGMHLSRLPAIDVHFVAPEMIAGTEAGPWTDIYLLGATLHWVLTSKPRHPGRTLGELLASAAISEPWPYGDDVPIELARFLPACGSIAVTIWPAWPDEVFNLTALATLIAMPFAFRDRGQRSANVDAP